ncbi:unnamed protein product [Dicrocoelium dendriticum]|nr:unnamed protein product [Dicrocoelium dendriticum]
MHQSSWLVGNEKDLIPSPNTTPVSWETNRPLSDVTLSISSLPRRITGFLCERGSRVFDYNYPPPTERNFSSPVIPIDKCLKWRILPFSQSLVGRDVPDTWQCRDNPDHKHKRCDDPEEDMSAPMGVLRRKIKTKEQRQAELEKLIRKKQEELELIKDPEDENDIEPTPEAPRPTRLSGPNLTKSVTAVSPRKRPPPPPPSPGPPSKKTSAIASPARAMTVAEKKRQAAVAANGPSTPSVPKRTGLPLPTTNQRQPRSGGLVPKIQHQASAAPKTRRVSTQDDSSEEEEEDDKAKEKEERITPKEPTKNKAADKPRVDKPQNGRAAAPEKSSHTKNLNSVPDTQRRSSASEKPAEKPTGPASSSQDRIPSATPVDSRSEKSKDPITETVSDSRIHVPTLDQNSTIGLASPEGIALNKRIHDKFKVCLRYFLPPEWPMQKDQIHTLTDIELANFPLEDFFDRYEQGLRSLLATFQQETKVYIDRLADVRSNVTKLLHRVDPTSQNVPLDGEEVDNYLSEYLAKSS